MHTRSRHTPPREPARVCTFTHSHTAHTPPRDTHDSTFTHAYTHTYTLDTPPRGHSQAFTHAQHTHCTHTSQGTHECASSRSTHTLDTHLPGALTSLCLHTGTHTHTHTLDTYTPGARTSLRLHTHTNTLITCTHTLCIHVTFYYLCTSQEHSTSLRLHTCAYPHHTPYKNLPGSLDKSTLLHALTLTCTYPLYTYPLHPRVTRQVYTFTHTRTLYINLQGHSTSLTAFTHILPTYPLYITFCYLHTSQGVTKQIYAFVHTLYTQHSATSAPPQGQLAVASSTRTPTLITCVPLHT